MNTKAANIWTSLLIIFGYSLIVVLAVIEPGEAYHGPQMVGVAISFFCTLACIGLVSIGFPFALKIISSYGKISYLFFLIPTFFLVIVFSLLAVLGLAGIGLDFEVKIFVAILGLLSIACLPLSIIWWFIAKKASKN